MGCGRGSHRRPGGRARPGGTGGPARSPSAARPGRARRRPARRASTPVPVPGAPRSRPRCRSARPAPPGAARACDVHRRCGVPPLTATGGPATRAGSRPGQSVGRSCRRVSPRNSVARVVPVFLRSGSGRTPRLGVVGRRVPARGTSRPGGGSAADLAPLPEQDAPRRVDSRTARSADVHAILIAATPCDAHPPAAVPGPAPGGTAAPTASPSLVRRPSQPQGGTGQSSTRTRQPPRLGTPLQQPQGDRRDDLSTDDRSTAGCVAGRRAPPPGRRGRRPRRHRPLRRHRQPRRHRRLPRHVD